MCKGVYKRSAMKPMSGGAYFLCPGCYARKQSAPETIEAEATHAGLPWHFDFYRQICRDHNMALAGAELITMVHVTDGYAEAMPTQVYEAFCALRRAWAS